MLTYPQQKSPLLRRQNSPNACLEQNLEQLDRMNLIFYLLLLSLYCTKDSTTVGEACFGEHLRQFCINIQLPVHGNFHFFLSDPCPIIALPCESFIPLVSPRCEIWLMSPWRIKIHATSACLTRYCHFWQPCCWCRNIMLYPALLICCWDSSVDLSMWCNVGKFQWKLSTTDACNWSLLRICKLQIGRVFEAIFFTSRVWSWNFVMSLKLNFCQNWCKNYEPLIQ